MAPMQYSHHNVKVIVMVNTRQKLKEFMSYTYNYMYMGILRLQEHTKLMCMYVIEQADSALSRIIL